MKIFNTTSNIGTLASIVTIYGFSKILCFWSYLKLQNTVKLYKRRNFQSLNLDIKIMRLLNSFFKEKAKE